MNYIVFDLEWNQEAEKKTEEPNLIPFEIIEIGAVKLNEKQEILDSFSALIQPQIYTTLDSKVSELIKHTMEELQEKGKPFPEVLKDFLNWCGEDPIFCTWGSMDLVELQRNMKFYHFPTLSRKPFFYYDVQSLFAIFFEAEKKIRALSFAADFFHITEKEEFHSAIGDAKYTAKIFQKFDLKKTKKYMEINYFNPPRKKEDEIYVSFKSYAKYISMEYKTREALLHAKNVKLATCPVCQENGIKKIDWFSNNSKNYFGVFQCKKHGYLKGKLRIKKSDNDRYFAVKTIKIISKEEALNLKKQKEDIHNKKAEKRHA